MGPAIAIGRYLGVTVLLFKPETDDGWVPAQFPDNERPGRDRKKARPYTYTGKGPDTWTGLLWGDQVQVVAELPKTSGS